ncbi:hypothetical protein CBS147347_4660 [Aspergillus niger]|nr:hypothetical protein CBS147347_4660 [Aspergillus niger]
MDLAAGVAGFVSLGLQVSQSIITYYNGWRHCREDVDDICYSVGEMRRMLTILEETVKRKPLKSCDGTADFEKLLKRCENTMRRLDAKVKKVQDNTASSGFIARARSEWERVKYPLKESTILKLRDILQEQKLDLILIINVLNTDVSSAESETLAQHMSQLSCDISQLEADVGENKNILKASVQASTIVTDLKRKEVLGWIYCQDPFMLYQSRESRRHPGTCQWFLQGREYLQWRSTGPLLWVKGEVGCGKSFLCSAVIRHLQSYCTAQSDNILVHFFFSFADSHRPNPLLCLSSILRQMCVNDRVLQNVEELYEKFNGSTASRPLEYHDIELALDSAIACLQQCKEIYIILDALDELPNDPDEYQRSRVLNWIKAISTRYRHVHILFTSRSNSNSRDIEDFVGTIPSIEIVTIDAMSNRDDMFSYLEAQFKKSHVLNKVPGHSLSQTLNSMISLSGGMFLWVHLQMVELTKLPTPRLKDIDHILKIMPPRLDDTPLRLVEVNESFKYLLDSGASPSGVLTEAIRGSSTLICQLLLDAGAVADEEIKGEIPLIVAARLDYDHICQVLLDYGADVNRLIEVDDWETWDPAIATDALTGATMFGNVETVELLLSNGAHIRGSALAYSLTGVEGGPSDKHREICNILIEHGADMNPDLGGFFNTPLAMALYNGWLDIARCMISKGARIEPSDPTCLLAGNILVAAVSSVDMTREILGIGVAADSPIAAVHQWAWEMDGDACSFTTALQAAAYHGHVETVELLLANGANPNVLGPPYGSTLFSLFAGTCYAMENIGPESHEKAAEKAYNLSVRDKTIQIYKILQERGVQNIIPWGSLNYDAYRTCVRGIKYSSIRTANAMTRSIDEKKFAILSGGTFCRVVRS